MCNLYSGCSIDVSYKVSVHLAKRFQKRKSTNQNKNCLWCPCLLTDRDEMYNCYRELFIDAFYQDLIHFGKAASEEKIFKNRPIRNKNCLWRPCLLTDRDKMSNHYRGPSIDAFYQVSVQLALRYQRRRLKCEKLTDDGRRTPSDGKSSHCLWQGELKSIH